MTNATGSVIADIDYKNVVSFPSRHREENTLNQSQ